MAFELILRGPDGREVVIYNDVSRYLPLSARRADNLHRKVLDAQAELNQKTYVVEISDAMRRPRDRARVIVRARDERDARAKVKEAWFSSTVEGPLPEDDPRLRYLSEESGIGLVKTYGTASGKLLDDKDIQELSDEAERGYDIEHLKHRADDDPEFVAPKPEGCTCGSQYHRSGNRLCARNAPDRKWVWWCRLCHLTEPATEGATGGEDHWCSGLNRGELAGHSSVRMWLCPKEAFHFEGRWRSEMYDKPKSASIEASLGVGERKTDDD